MKFFSMLTSFLEIEIENVIFMDLLTYLIYREVKFLKNGFLLFFFFNCVVEYQEFPFTLFPWNL